MCKQYLYLDKAIGETTLLARDIDGNGSTDGYYDTLLNITWLAKFNTIGIMNWNAASIWANATSFFKVSGWRFPTTNDTGIPGCDYAFTGTDCGFNVQTSTGNAVNSEMAHLYYVTLGNKAYYDRSGAVQSRLGISNTASFEGFQPIAYWSGTEYAVSPITGAWDFKLDGSFAPGYQGVVNKDAFRSAVAVHAGDVGTSVALPPTAGLILLGFGAIALLRRMSLRAGDFWLSPTKLS